MKIEYLADTDNFKVIFNDLPHVIFRRDEFLATRAYAEVPTENTPKQYCIEFIMNGNSFTCKYADRQMWVEVLQILNKHT